MVKVSPWVFERVLAVVVVVLVESEAGFWCSLRLAAHKEMVGALVGPAPSFASVTGMREAPQPGRICEHLLGTRLRARRRSVNGLQKPLPLPLLILRSQTISYRVVHPYGYPHSKMFHCSAR
jgi:hypothetical protein